ncbi:TraR/DksA family transcriptional regulator [Streptomyces sp. NPDC046831]|uniref:TraR/DksA family transcriptional regulator n=1 Tax=Streptomyces sp. NPDC046831 TaxID=3154805 RepID=UPI0033D85A85
MVAKKTAEHSATGRSAKDSGGAAEDTRGKTGARVDGAESGTGAAAKRTTGVTAGTGAAPPARKNTARKAGRKTTADAVGKKAGAARAAKQTGATTVGAKKTPGTVTAEQSAVPKARGDAAEPGDLAVRPGEDPWTADEVEEARAGLQSEMERLDAEITTAEQSLAGLMRDSGDGAGDDQADTGTKNITREHEMALTANAREMLTQTERALDRLATGTYGLCETCGKPIGKARMQAFPRATLCVECKQKQERR